MSILALEHQFSSVTTKKPQFTNLACMKLGKEYVCVMPLSTQHLLYGDFKSQIKYPQKNSENLRLLKTRSEPAILVFSRNNCSNIGCFGNKNANENSMYFFYVTNKLKVYFKNDTLCGCLFQSSSIQFEIFQIFWKLGALDCWMGLFYWCKR